MSKVSHGCISFFGLVPTIERPSRGSTKSGRSPRRWKPRSMQTAIGTAPQIPRAINTASRSPRLENWTARRNGRSAWAACWPACCSPARRMWNCRHRYPAPPPSRCSRRCSSVLHQTRPGLLAGPASVVDAFKELADSPAPLDRWMAASFHLAEAGWRSAIRGRPISSARRRRCCWWR